MIDTGIPTTGPPHQPASKDQRPGPTHREGVMYQAKKARLCGRESSRNRHWKGRMRYRARPTGVVLLAFLATEAVFSVFSTAEATAATPPQTDVRPMAGWSSAYDLAHTALPSLLATLAATGIAAAIRWAWKKASGLHRKPQTTPSKETDHA
ncbi:hypothetical protein [Streptomyces sp. NPDC001678]|uniref:hypothetical protein n=1 Tax=Streptomyces sp. NPDC001678 TaxID=3364599 RepID=UPI0036BE3809